MKTHFEVSCKRIHSNKVSILRNADFGIKFQFQLGNSEQDFHNEIVERKQETLLLSFSQKLESAAKARVQVFQACVDDAFSPSRGYHLAFNIVRNQQSSFRSFQQEFVFLSKPIDKNIHFFQPVSIIRQIPKLIWNKELETV
ncbi:hypothetical protein ABPG74_014282 [Tetrahymena malaccensis]